MTLGKIYEATQCYPMQAFACKAGSSFTLTFCLRMPSKPRHQVVETTRELSMGNSRIGDAKAAGIYGIEY
jgi:hypothetical protein